MRSGVQISQLGPKIFKNIPCGWYFSNGNIITWQGVKVSKEVKEQWLWTVGLPNPYQTLNSVEWDEKQVLTIPYVVENCSLGLEYHIYSC